MYILELNTSGYMRRTNLTNFYEIMVDKLLITDVKMELLSRLSIAKEEEIRTALKLGVHY